MSLPIFHLRKFRTERSIRDKDKFRESHLFVIGQSIRNLINEKKSEYYIILYYIILYYIILYYIIFRNQRKKNRRREKQKKTNKTHGK
jgi:amino acid permease